MPQENLLTIQQYATRYKMSTFAVIKLVTSKKLKTLKQNDQEFIIDENVVVKPKQEIAESEGVQSSLEEGSSSSINYEVEFHTLLAKYIELQEKYTKLIEEKHQH